MQPSTQGMLSDRRMRQLALLVVVLGLIFGSELTAQFVLAAEAEGVSPRLLAAFAASFGAMIGATLASCHWRMYLNATAAGLIAATMMLLLPVGVAYLATAAMLLLLTANTAVLWLRDEVFRTTWRD